MDFNSLVWLLKFGTVSAVVLVCFHIVRRYGRQRYRKGFEAGFRAGRERWEKEKTELYKRLNRLARGETIIAAKKKGVIKNDETKE